MKESEIIQIFMNIQNVYSNFAFDDYKIQLWQRVLKDVPYKVADENLMRYVLDPENKFPPHPGELAKEPEGRYIPNSTETREMLEKQEKEWREKAVPMPEHLKGLKFLGRRN